MARISLNVDDSTLQAFDNLWKKEGWESRQEALVFLMKKAVAEDKISDEKSKLVKAIKGGNQ